MPTAAITTAPRSRLHPLLELRDWITASLARYRTTHQYGPLGREQVTADIAADCLVELATTARAAHSAEIHDLEARTLLDRVLADGAVTPDELPTLRRARALVDHSARTDHDLADRSTLSA